MLRWWCDDAVVLMCASAFRLFCFFPFVVILSTHYWIPFDFIIICEMVIFFVCFWVCVCVSVCFFVQKHNTFQRFHLIGFEIGWNAIWSSAKYNVRTHIHICHERALTNISEMKLLVLTYVWRVTCVYS